MRQVILEVNMLDSIGVSHALKLSKCNRITVGVMGMTFGVGRAESPDFTSLS